MDDATVSEEIRDATSGLCSDVTSADALSLLHALLKYSSDGILFVSADLKILAANAVFAKQVGLPLDQIVGKRARFIPGWSQMQAVIRKVRQAGQEVSGEGVSSNFAGGADPGMFLWEYTAMPVYAGSRGLTGYLFQVHDVTNERMAAQESAQLLAQWEALFETIPDPIYVNDAPDHLVSANKAALDLMGVSSLAEFTKSDLRSLSPFIPMSRQDGSELPFDERPAARAVAGQTFTNYLCRMTNTKGQEFVVSYSGGQVRPVEGVARRSFVIGRDVTEQQSLQSELSRAKQQLEAALQESESAAAEWQAVFEGLSEAIFLADSKGIVTAVNKAGIRILGYQDPTDMVGKRIREVSPVHIWSEGRKMQGPWDPAASCQDIGFENRSFKFLNLQGREVEVLASVGDMQTPKGRRFFLICRDVTDLRRLERSRQELIQVISHELRNPFQVIKGLSQLIRLKLCGKGVSRISDQLDLLDSQINSVSRLLEDILTAYRIGSGRLALQFQKANLLNLVADTMTPFIMAGTHELVVETAGLSEVSLYCDGDRVSQIITNLLSNAVKYTPTGSRIWVKVGTSDDRYAVVRVEDEGIGIPPGELNKVFEGFYRAGNLPEGSSGGVGLGLYISREFARRHGGDLWAENRSEGGTSMVFRLPLYGV